MRPGSKQDRLGALTIFIANRFLLAIVTLSFGVTLVPIVGASLNKAQTKACCVGKAAGHCDSGIVAEKPPPKQEPMCGLNTAESDDVITIVAEPAQPRAHHHNAEFSSTKPEASQTAAESASIDHPCEMNCGACATASSRQKREKAIAESITWNPSPLTTNSHFNSASFSVSLNEVWEQLNPRGPPANLSSQL